MPQYLRLLSFVLLTLVSYPAAAQLDLAAAMKDRVLGKAEAPVTIIEYASFTCPHCANFHTVNLKDLKARYIDTGKVKLVYRDFPLDGLALRASMVARCAPESAYFGFVEVLFKSQRTWVLSDGAKALGALEQVARLGGMSKADFDACMSNEPLIDALLKVRQDSINTFKIESTPSFVINGKTYAGDKAIDEMAKIIDPLLVGH